MKFEKGELYYIRFLDHCISPDHEVMECEVCGWVLSEDDVRVTATWWNVIDDECKEDNSEPVNIIKSTILKKRKISIS